ncbi:hypothetical protein [Luteolibacter luteus]|uniref:Glycosyltransferase family 1 protein n=1 Tax=Luteolibacter luteus TaxID=2728835 RepID=A0A858RCB0_9BACT|nr:hypothetical protein [Luteolibacter luteus]QJE94281.1 hypothetical protein HHL09_00260 [Luteolibacter luteus]
MSKCEVIWFRNSHDHSVHYFKLGLMRLARQGEIRFREMRNEEAGELLPAKLREHKHRRTATLSIREGNGKPRIVVLDGEDSIFQLSPLIESCDRYFSCTYRRRFFEGEDFDLALPWQTEDELSHYRDRYRKLQQDYRAHMPKARPLMPIGPDLEWTGPVGGLERKLQSLRHRISKLRAPWLDWQPQHESFEKRWSHFERLRALPVDYDVSLKDSLWGWPRHRTALHRELARHADRYQIRTDLTFRNPLDFELGQHPAPDPKDYPMKSGGGVTGNYEEQIARSRLGVFATGFHYGCRSIVTLAWLLGVRTFSDPLSFESIYDFDELGGLSIHRSGDWSELAQELETARNEAPSARLERQATFDRIASPERAARWILEETLAGTVSGRSAHAAAR